MRIRDGDTSLGGATVARQAPHMVTETLIRGMYRYYREAMGP